MRSELRQQLCRLFVALEHGEQLAHQCAKKQASYTNDAKAHRFLRSQAHQEFMHAAFFRTAIRWLMPKHQYEVPTALQTFGTRLQKALLQNDLVDSLVGSQIVLEGFGEQILVRLNRGMDNQNVGFRRQRAILLRQEQSHYDFGLRTLQHLVETGQATPARIHHLAEEYLHQVHLIIDEMAEVFDALDEDAEEYRAGLIDNLPGWIVERKM